MSKVVNGFFGENFVQDFHIINSDNDIIKVKRNGTILYKGPFYIYFDKLPASFVYVLSKQLYKMIDLNGNLWIVEVV